MVLQPLRDKIRRAIHRTSWYRSPLLNKHPDIEGSPTSDHLDGSAADIFVHGMAPAALATVIWEMGLPVKQVITYPEKGIVHVSYDPLNSSPPEYLTPAPGGGFTAWEPAS